MFNFLLYVLMIGIPVAFGILAHSLNPGFNLWDWMFHSFPGSTWYTQNLWHFIIVAILSITLAALIVRYVFRLNTKKHTYLACNTCSSQFHKGPGSTVIPF